MDAPSLRPWLALARPRHWVKNVFVVMPAPFSVASGGVLEPISFGLGLLGFCLASSAVYAFNDAHDAEHDRSHPAKRLRPVASGAVSAGAARALALVLLLAAIGLTLAADRAGTLAILAAYVGLNLVYCLGARALALVDVFLLSSGYVLRVLFGCALLEVVASGWLLLCTWTLALFLALAKRRGDVVAGMDDTYRPSLSGYDLHYLDLALGVTAATALIGYAIYCMEAEVLVDGREFATLPFVAFGILEYLRLVVVRGESASPVDLVLSSPALVLAGIGWAGATLWSVAL